jgi:hypothetical protein
MVSAFTDLIPAAVQQVAAEQHLAQMSHHMDAMEELADAEFFTISHGSGLALGNLLARLDRLKLTIELAAAA